jgi:prephenate dehydrogenase
MTITIIGTGLIGGSMALSLKELKIATRIIGVDTNADHLQKALDLGIIDEILPLTDAIGQSGLIILSIPVHATEKLLPLIMDNVTTQVVMDTGSTKEQIINSVKDHPKRSRFVATHPMWGTENSGPGAAVSNGFSGRVTIISDKENSDKEAITMVEDIYMPRRTIFMRPT